MKTPPLTFVPMEVEEKPQTGLENMSRVIPPQLSHIQLDEQSRYVLVRKGLQLGINIVHDTTPEVEEALLTLGLPTGKLMIITGADWASSSCSRG